MPAWIRARFPFFAGEKPLFNVNINKSNNINKFWVDNGRLWSDLGLIKNILLDMFFFIHQWAPCWIFAEGRFRKSQHLPRCANSLFWWKVDLQANSMTNTLPTTHVHCPTYQARFYKSKWNGHLFHKSWHLPPPNHCFGQLCCGCAICPSVCLAITHAPPSKSQTLDLTVLVHAYCILHMTMVMMTMSLPMMKVNLLEFSAFGGVGKLLNCIYGQKMRPPIISVN